MDGYRQNYAESLHQKSKEEKSWPGLRIRLWIREIQKFSSDTGPYIEKCQFRIHLSKKVGTSRFKIPFKSDFSQRLLNLIIFNTNFPDGRIRIGVNSISDPQPYSSRMLFSLNHFFQIRFFQRNILYRKYYNCSTILLPASI